MLASCDVQLTNVREGRLKSGLVASAERLSLILTTNPGPQQMDTNLFPFKSGEINLGNSPASEEKKASEANLRRSGADQDSFI